MSPLIPSCKKRTLCIDDDEAILSYERALLERSGYSVVLAASARPCNFDAVLLDYEMPDMNGCDVTFEIKRVRPGVDLVFRPFGPVQSSP